MEIGRQLERRPQIDRHVAVVDGRIEPRGVVWFVDGGVVDQDVERPEPVLRARQKARRLVDIFQIAHDHTGPAAFRDDPLRQIVRCGSRTRARMKSDSESLSHEPERDGPADAPGRSGHERIPRLCDPVRHQRRLQLRPDAAGGAPASTVSSPYRKIQQQLRTTAPLGAVRPIKIHPSVFIDLFMMNIALTDVVNATLQKSVRLLVRKRRLSSLHTTGT